MNYEQKYKDALDAAKHIYDDMKSGWNFGGVEDLEVIFPELRESEDERITRAINNMLPFIPDEAYANNGVTKEDVLAWLEKQKEQPEEGLVYRLNGLMQDYIKDGKDEEEREHRRKCNLLFWDALADETFFEQKEQKPVDISKSDNNSEMSDANGHLTGKILVEYGAHAKVRDGKRHCEMDWKEFQRLAHYFYELGKAEQKPAMIQWTGNNLKEVVDFTGKSPRFNEWFKTWEEFEAYVHSHGDVFKIFKDDGSHYEVPIGAWIVRTPDGYNVASRSTFKQKPAEWSEEDENMLNRIEADIRIAAKHSKKGMSMSFNKDIAWLKSLRPDSYKNCNSRWKPSEEQMYSLGTVVKGAGENSVGSVGYNLKELYEQLKAL